MFLNLLWAQAKELLVVARFARNGTLGCVATVHMEENRRSVSKNRMADVFILQ